MFACSCQQAQSKVKADASAIYVPGSYTGKAIEEAIEAEIPLVVAVAEHVPLHDILRVGSLPQLISPLSNRATDSLHAEDAVENATGRG